MEQIASYFSHLLSPRVLPFHLLVIGLAWLGHSSATKASYASTNTASMCGGACGSNGQVASASSSGCACGSREKMSAKTVPPRPAQTSTRMQLPAPVSITPKIELQPKNKPAPLTPAPPILPASPVSARPFASPSSPPSPAPAESKKP